MDGGCWCGFAASQPVTRAYVRRVRITSTVTRVIPPTGGSQTRWGCDGSARLMLGGRAHNRKRRTVILRASWHPIDT
jgi:hypothetical protein